MDGTAWPQSYHLSSPLVNQGHRILLYDIKTHTKALNIMLLYVIIDVWTMKITKRKA